MKNLDSKKAIQKTVISAALFTAVLNPISVQAADHTNTDLDVLDDETNNRSTDEILSDAISNETELTNLNTNTNSTDLNTDLKNDSTDNQNIDSQKDKADINEEDKTVVDEENKENKEKNTEENNTNNNIDNKKDDEITSNDLVDTLQQIKDIIVASEDSKLPDYVRNEIIKTINSADISEHEKELYFKKVNDYILITEQWAKGNKEIQKNSENVEKKDVSKLNEDLVVCENILDEVTDINNNVDSIIDKETEIVKILNSYTEDELSAEDKVTYEKIKGIHYWLKQFRLMSDAGIYIQYSQEGELARDNELGYDQKDNVVSGKPVTDFTPDISRYGCNVPVELMKKYIHAEYFTHHRLAKDQSGTGSAIDKDNIYYLLDNDYKTYNNEPLKFESLEVGKLYFHPYVIKWHNGYVETDTYVNGYHLDGYLMTLDYDHNVVIVPVYPGFDVRIPDITKKTEPDTTVIPPTVINDKIEEQENNTPVTPVSENTPIPEDKPIVDINEDEKIPIAPRTDEKIEKKSSEKKTPEFKSNINRKKKHSSHYNHYSHSTPSQNPITGDEFPMLSLAGMILSGVVGKKMMRKNIRKRNYYKK